MLMAAVSFVFEMINNVGFKFLASTIKIHK